MDPNIAPGPEWEYFSNCWSVCGEREAFLLASIAPPPDDSPDVIPLQGAGELSEEDRRKLDSQGVPPDCCDDVSIVRARLTLDPGYQLSGEEVSNTGRELTRGYVLGQLKEFLNSVEKPGAYIYYIGHGKKGTGDWCFSDGFITFSDIIHLYHTTNIKGRLLGIVSNCSYSGAWVKECAQYLDEQGVRACGHSAAEKGFLLKVYTSCTPSEVAHRLVYSAKAMDTDKNKRTLSFFTSKELLSSQHAFGINFTVLRCGKMPQDQCSLTLPKYTWTKRYQGDLIYLVKGLDKGRDAWYYVLLVDNEETISAFKVALKEDIINVEQYGKILFSAYGKEPPNTVTDEVQKQYMNVYQ